MTESKAKGFRAVQVLMALREHGPLSRKTMRQFIVPEISGRRIRDVTERLCKNGLILRYHSSLPDNAGHFYQIAQSRAAREEIGEILEIDSEEVRVAHVRGHELKHAEQCAKWAEFFKRVFPQARVVRDWEYRNESGLVMSLVNNERNRDLMPDILIILEKEDGKQKVIVGVEVERTLKKPERLVQKMKNLVMQTQLDGVLYVCEQFEVAESVRRAFSKHAFAKSKRIGRYVSNFLLFSKFDAVSKSSRLDAVNLELRCLEIQDWMSALRANPAHLRQNFHFEIPTGPGRYQGENQVGQ